MLPNEDANMSELASCVSESDLVGESISLLLRTLRLDRKRSEEETEIKKIKKQSINQYFVHVPCFNFIHIPGIDIEHFPKMHKNRIQIYKLEKVFTCEVFIALRCIDVVVLTESLILRWKVDVGQLWSLNVS